jgi:hypothetical protein
MCNMKLMERLHQAVNASGHNGKIRTLKEDVHFIDGTTWPEGLRVLILGVNYCWATVKSLGVDQGQTAKIVHRSINW